MHRFALHRIRDTPPPGELGARYEAHAAHPEAVAAKLRGPLGRWILDVGAATVAAEATEVRVLLPYVALKLERLQKAVEIVRELASSRSDSPYR